jgi:ketosteroid isomerase-like protein
VNTEQLADSFTRAVREVENNHDLKPMVALFAADAMLFNPVFTQGVKGHDGIERFWRLYRDTFSDVRSRFRRTLVCGNTAALEWRSDGHLADGKTPVRYSGVTMLDFDGQKISQMKVYYDTLEMPRLLALNDAKPGAETRAQRSGLGHGYGPGPTK